MPGRDAQPRSRGIITGGLIAGWALLVWAGAGLAQDGPPPDRPIGRPASPEEIAAWDIDIEPDGRGLPAGRGTVASGAEVYKQQCQLCHGPTGREVPGDAILVPVVARNWCCATTLYDYIYRAMPFYRPQSLRPDDVYGLVALLLYWNDIVPEDFVANSQTVPRVRMPANERYGVNPYTSADVPQEGDPWAPALRLRADVQFFAGLRRVTPLKERSAGR
jgi:cytochrome c